MIDHEAALEAAVAAFAARTARADAAADAGGAPAALAALAPLRADAVQGGAALQFEAQAALRGFRLHLAVEDPAAARSLLESYEARSAELAWALNALISLELSRLDLREDALALAIHRSLQVLRRASEEGAADLAAAAALVGGRATLRAGDHAEASRAFTLGREAFRAWWGHPGWRDGSPLDAATVGEELWTQSALLALEQGELDTAQALLGELTARAPEGGALRLLVGALLQARRGLPSAQSALRAVLRAPAVDTSIQARALLELAVGEADPAARQSWLEAAVAAAPADSGVARRVAFARVEEHLLHGDVEAAWAGLEALDPAALTLGEQAQAVRLRALGHLERGEQAEALRWLRLALEGDRLRGARQATAEDHRLIASTLRRLGEDGAALAQLDAAEQLVGERPDLALERALIALNLPQHPEAEAWIAAALALPGAQLPLPERLRWLLLGAARRRPITDALRAAQDEAAARGAAGLAHLAARALDDGEAAAAWIGRC